ncbi:2Fe-2S iron-sulfur cluster-binding protein [Streptomyces decoyicus]|uniref:2Fe-2S iron-sulfur cluster-binding protein n=1 Tax=Streptomyces decoyicus TaxID=249567 RepID=UPI00363F8CC9
MPTRWSCRAGVCHTCITHLVAGDITYTTQPLDSPRPAPSSSAVATRPPKSSSTPRA